MKVGKMWWRWRRRMEEPPLFGHRERWWRWLALVRGLMVAMEEGRLVCWGWVSWVEAVERWKEVAWGRTRQEDKGNWRQQGPLAALAEEVARRK